MLESGRFRRAARDKLVDERGALIAITAAAIGDEEEHHRPETLQIGPVDDRAAFPLALHQPRAGKNPQMRRERVVWNFQLPGDFTGGNSGRLMANQKPEYVQPGCLREGAKSENDAFIVHISFIVDITDNDKATTPPGMTQIAYEIFADTDENAAAMAVPPPRGAGGPTPCIGHHWR